MPYPKSTIIVSVYKDTEALGFILDSLEYQTYPVDEIIISEDGDSSEMRNFIATQKDRFPNLVHLTQEDDGWRKNIAMNNSIKASRNEYLIFIDGDCVPYSNFIQGHIENAQHGIVLCGKRFELGSEYTDKIKNKTLTFKQLENHFLWHLPWMAKDSARHVEEGFHFSSGSFLSNITKRYVRYIIGCNFSCYKEDFLKINGFDETYKLPSVGEDIDLGWRFRGLGIELKSCRNNACMMHLWHKKRFDATQGDINNKILKANFDKNNFVCQNGIVKQGV
ncbi:MAG: glycosyltransferase [Sulfuricurvum sp.]|nr:glycosyltransferase [Sulfuricurvum sp.]